MKTIENKKPKTTIIGVAHVADCEHRGDLISMKKRILSTVPQSMILNTYWDGKDCGEAYVEFSFPSTHFHKVYDEMYDYCTFNADINDYVNFFGSSVITNGVKLNKTEFLRELKKRKYDISKGFEHRIPVHLFFEAKKNIDVNGVIDKAKETLGETCEIIAFNKSISDGSLYIDILFTADINAIQEEAFESFGDYALGNSAQSFLELNKIYGALTCVHALMFCRRYDVFQFLAKKVIKKKPITYCGDYKRNKISVSYDVYSKNDVFQVSVPVRGTERDYYTVLYNI